jgi:hypothetical protein
MQLARKAVKSEKKPVNAGISALMVVSVKWPLESGYKKVARELLKRVGAL